MLDNIKTITFQGYWSFTLKIFKSIARKHIVCLILSYKQLHMLYHCDPSFIKADLKFFPLVFYIVL